MKAYLESVARADDRGLVHTTVRTAAVGCIDVNIRKVISANGALIGDGIITVIPAGAHHVGIVLILIVADKAERNAVCGLVEIDVVRADLRAVAACADIYGDDQLAVGFGRDGGHVIIQVQAGAVAAGRGVAGVVCGGESAEQGGDHAQKEQTGKKSCRTLFHKALSFLNRRYDLLHLVPRDGSGNITFKFAVLPDGFLSAVNV